MNIFSEHDTRFSLSNELHVLFRRGALIVGALVLAGCATPATQVGPEGAEVDTEANLQLRMALEDQIAQERKIDGVVFRLMSAAAEFCGEQTTYDYGMVLANRNSFEGSRQALAATTFGLDDSVRVLSVLPGSPAAEAGLREGDSVLGIGGQAMQGGAGAVARANEALKKAGPAGTELALAGPNSRRVSIQPVAVCDYPVQVMDTDKINAYADGARIRITRGMVWFAREETELALVISHELAHNVMGHAGLFANAFADKKSQEADADYVGLYIMARAGYAIEQAPLFWRRVAVAFPSMIESSASHPLMPQRFVALKKATEEIRDKESRGLPLIPSHGGILAVLTPGPGAT